MPPRNLANRFRLARAYLGRRDLLGALPFEIAIGITNRCNLDCSFCPQKASPRPRGDISLDLLDHLLAQAAPFVDTVDLSFDGEPFLHPRWEECVGLCRRRGVRPILQTNALLLDAALARRVLASGLFAITFSIDAAGPESYRRIKPGGDYGRAVANAERFLALSAGRPGRPYTTIQFVQCAENASESGAFLRRWRGRGADCLRIKPRFNFGGSVGPAPARGGPGPCVMPWMTLSIHWDGAVPMCCMEIEGRSRMGDASREPLLELVDNAAFRALRRLHAEGRASENAICRACDVPPVAAPFVLGAALAGDWTRRQVISYIHKFGFLRSRGVRPGGG